MLFPFSGCSFLQGPPSLHSQLESEAHDKLAIVALRDAQRGEVLQFDELGFRMIPQSAYTPLHLRLEQCNNIDGYALRTNVRASQPLMRKHFRGL